MVALLYEWKYEAEVWNTIIIITSYSVSHLSFHIFIKQMFHYFRDYLMMKLTLE
jgi:hypothetical protein